MGSAVLPWKVATVVCTALAIGFAVRSRAHPIPEPESTSETDDARYGGGARSISPRATGSSRFVMSTRVSTLVARIRRTRGSAETCRLVADLGRTGSSDAVEPLFSLVTTNRTTAIRVCAIDALRSVADRAVLVRIADLVNDADPDVRSRALDLLAASGDSEATDVVFTAAHGADPDTRIAALVALAENRVAGTLPEIVAALTEAEDGDRDSLIRAMGETGDPAATRTLVSLLEQSDTSWRNTLYVALARIGSPEAMTALRDAANSSDPRDASDAVAALANAPRESAMPTLVAMASEPTDARRIDALRALSDSDDEEVRRLMRTTISSDSASAARLALQYVLVHHDAESIAAVADVVRRGVVTPLTHDALNTLATLGGDEARNTLADLARDTGPIRGQALEALRTVRGGESTAREIAYAALRERDGALENALGIIADDPSPRAREVLAHEASSPSGSVASQAMSYLARRRDPESIAEMRRLAANSNPDVRTRALAAFGQEGGPESERLLTEAFHSADPGVRDTAMNAIAQLGGAPLQRTFDEAINGSDPAMRTAAASLVQRDDVRVTTAQLTNLAQQEAGYGGFVALRRLATQDPDAAIPLIESRIDSESARDYSLRDLTAAFPADTQRRIYERALSGGRPESQLVAIDALTALGGSAFQQQLVTMLSADSIDPSVRYNAASTLREMGGPLADANRAAIDAIVQQAVVDE